MQYDPSFLDFHPILSDAQKADLEALALRLPLDEFLAGTRNPEEMMVDFVYTSAKIEGNTYSRLDTDVLLRLGITSGGKRFNDAVMLVNLRAAFEKAMDMADDAGESSESPLDMAWAAGIHQVIMRDLLPASQLGCVRREPVRIGGSTYRPLTDPDRLKVEMQHMLATASQYDNPFERAIYLHCNTAYLQYFQDGNKRTARILQTASMAQSGLLPLFFQEELIGQYLTGTISYYETGSYESYADFFVSNHRMVVDALKPVLAEQSRDAIPDRP